MREALAARFKKKDLEAAIADTATPEDLKVVLQKELDDLIARDLEIAQAQEEADKEKAAKKLEQTKLNEENRIENANRVAAEAQFRQEEIDWAK